MFDTLFYICIALIHMHHSPICSCILKYLLSTWYVPSTILGDGLMSGGNGVSEKLSSSALERISWTKILNPSQRLVFNYTAWKDTKTPRWSDTVEPTFIIESEVLFNGNKGKLPWEHVQIYWRNSESFPEKVAFEMRLERGGEVCQEGWQTHPHISATQ